jgi:hypothetical protein
MTPEVPAPFVRAVNVSASRWVRNWPALNMGLEALQQKGTMQKHKKQNPKARKPKAGKFEVDLLRTTHKLQPNEQLRLIVGNVAICLSIASAKPSTITTPKSKETS